MMRTYEVTYTSGKTQSAGDEGFRTRGVALRSLLRRIELATSDDDAYERAWNLFAIDHADGRRTIRLLAAKYEYESDLRIFPQFFRS